ncbi:MAG: hypothetical protein QM572_05805 [Nocardioides sp.]|uniref:hypothetical protein n=1 Tax=Nocardioides sp. TaxID=35761 RepID=UPI0039E21540
MTVTKIDNSNRGRSEAFKTQVLLRFLQHGHRTAKLNRITSIAEGIKHPGSMSGLPVGVSIHAGLSLKVSETLDAAVVAATLTGKEYAVGIHARRGRSIGEAYAVMTLDHFLDMLGYVPEEDPLTD